MKLINLIVYKAKNGKEPYSEWEDSLDKVAQAVVASRLDRVRLGNFGDSKVIKGARGIKELRINFGPGYRIYFAMDGEMVVILLVGGSKGTQSRDIEKAKKFWLDYMGQ